MVARPLAPEWRGGRSFALVSTPTYSASRGPLASPPHEITAAASDTPSTTRRGRRAGLLARRAAVTVVLRSVEPLPGSGDVVRADGDDEIVTTILLIRFVTRALVDGPLLTIADHIEPRCVEALAHEVSLRRVRATQAQRHVVFVRSTRVGIALDTDLHARIAAQQRHLVVQRRLRVGANLRFVEVEVDRRAQ